LWAALRPDSIAVLKDQKCQRSLSRYFAVFQRKKYAKYLIARHLKADFSPTDSAEELWRKHSQLLEEFRTYESVVDAGTAHLDESVAPSRSFLGLKAEIAKRILQRCHFCERRCGVDRTEGELGFCGCGATATVSSFFEHMGEEPELVPSGTIFTCGCTMRCLHCQNWTISQNIEAGDLHSPESLARIVDHLRRQGCRNVNLVGGEPTPWLYHWLETFLKVKENVPVVWNSNSYYSPETTQLLAGFADVYLLDFKYGPGDCATRISSAPNYWDVCTRNHLMAKKHGELIIRVLVLPTHNSCCTKPILGWISKNLGAETRVNLMDQYRPEWRAHEVPELRRRLTGEEFHEARQIAREAGLTNVIT
jgi:putative pyruvate formate lyase activating enzyme